MIKDKLKNAKNYFGISDNIKAGLNWLLSNDLENIPDGKYELSDDIYVNVQTYTTKDEGLYEAHQKYTDIQYMIKGEEKAGVKDYSLCKTETPYNQNNDIEFLSCSENDEYYNLKEGEFFIFFPHDAHKPSIKISENKKVKKAVVKVKI